MAVGGEYTWIVLAIATGIIVVYYICLRVSDNAWIGNRPPGPRHQPFIGCYLVYAGTRNLEALIKQLFLQYGDMFTLSIFSHKIVFIRDSKELKAALAKEEVTDCTLAKVADILQGLGMHPLEEPELQLMAKAWKTYEDSGASVRCSSSNGPDLTCLVKHLQEADHQLAVEWGELKSQPRIYSAYQLSSEDAEAGHPAQPAQRAYHAALKIRDLILRQGHVFLAKSVPFPTAIYARKRGRKWVEEARIFLDEATRRHGLRTDRDLLLLFFLLAVLSRGVEQEELLPAASQPIAMLDGPSIGGYHCYQCNEYITLHSCNIPHKTLIIAQ